MHTSTRRRMLLTEGTGQRSGAKNHLGVSEEQKGQYSWSVMKEVGMGQAM